MSARSGATVLVTGVAGFLGRYVSREFARRGWRVVGIDLVAVENAPPEVEYYRMALPSAELGTLLASVAPLTCIHCAGRASVGHSVAEPAVDFRESVCVTFELLDAIRRSAPKCRTILLSSAAVYGNPASLPVTEGHQAAPLSPYGYHKLICETLAEEFNRTYGLATAVVRIFSAYGPGLRRQVVWDICQRALSSDSLRLHGTGEESRDFIHAADVAAALYAVAEGAAFHAEAYNVATGYETTIRSLAEQLVEILHTGVRPEFDGQATPGDPRNWRADVTRLSGLGFVPRIGLSEGLKTVAVWATAELVPVA
jgi:UDP-glucose 4-epimerase